MLRKRLFSVILSFILLCSTLLPAWALDVKKNVDLPAAAINTMKDIPQVQKKIGEARSTPGFKRNVDFSLSESVQKADRYIVKYRQNKEDDIESRLSRSEISHSEVELMSDAVSNLKLLTLNEKISPFELENELRTLNVFEEIEYIQLDHKLELESVEEFRLELQKTKKGIEDFSETEPEQGIGTQESFDQDPVITQETDISEAPTLDSDQSDNIFEMELEPLVALEIEPIIESIIEPIEDNFAKIEDGIFEDNVYQTLEVPKPVKVALIDTGVDISHELLDGYIDTENAYDFVDDDTDVFDDEWPMLSCHGTHIAGIIAKTARETGADVSILPLKVFDNGTAYTSDIIAAIEYAESCGASVVNCSFGSISENPALKEAIKNSEMLFLCAVGNNRRDLRKTASYPACFELPNVVSVGSVNQDGGFSYFSSYGDVDIAAVGRDVISALPENMEGKMTGTSMSAGVVTGAAAAVLSYGETLQNVRMRLLSCSDRLLNLQDKITDGRRLNLSSVIAGVTQEEIIDVSPQDDFDPTGYAMTQSELFELYTQAHIVQISTGSAHTLLLDENGKVWAWGDNTYGQTGVGYVGGSGLITEVIGLDFDVIKIQAGANSSFALKSDGTVWVWGEMAETMYSNTAIPEQIYDLYMYIGDISYNGGILMASDDYVAYEWAGSGQLCWIYLYLNEFSISAGVDTNFILDEEGGWLFQEGYDYYDWIGLFDGVTEISTGVNHSVLLMESGMMSIYDHMTGDLWFVPEISDAAMVYAGYDGAYATNLSGDVYRIVYDTFEVSSIEGLENIIQITSEDDHVLALKDDGTVYGWGGNTSGELGNAVILSMGDESIFSMELAYGETYTLSLVGKNVTSFNNREITVTYSDSQLYTPEVIEGGNVAAVTTVPGVVTITADKVIPTNKTWSGVLAVLRFKAKTTSTTQITIQIN